MPVAEAAAQPDGGTGPLDEATRLARLSHCFCLLK